MKTTFDCVAKLSEQELLDHFTALVVRDRRTTAELLVAIAEIDERKIWAAHACSSMFTFCMERFHMSEQVAAKRIWAARTARRFPVVLDLVARGEMHLGAIHLLARHLTEENHARVLERAKHKSSRQIEELVAEIAPRADVPSRIRALPGRRGDGAGGGGAVVRTQSAADFSDGGSRGADSRGEASSDGESSDHDFSDGASSASSGVASADGNLAGDALEFRIAAAGGSNDCIGKPYFASTHEARTRAKPIVPLSPRRYKIEITVDQTTHDKLRSLQDLLGRSATGSDPAAIISRAIDVLLARTLARKAACTDRPKPSSSAKSATPANPLRSEQPGTATPVSPVHADQGTTTSTLRSRILAHDSKPAASATRTRREPRDSTARDVGAADAQRRSRSIPAVVRREVWERDSGRCRYSDARGRRCTETRNVEFHHKAAFARGGPPTTENIELRCAAHNQFQADLDFGRSFMNAKRGNVRATFPGECWR